MEKKAKTAKNKVKTPKNDVKPNKSYLIAANNVKNNAVTAENYVNYQKGYRNCQTMSNLSDAASP